MKKDIFILFALGIFLYSAASYAEAHEWIPGARHRITHTVVSAKTEGTKVSFTEQRKWWGKVWFQHIGQ